ncbi:hypothetical protein C1H46_036952 [Malus baccata]|uniref:Uncharacterized protein n=1 Tax=Malus baccata TaxID=106549 RepID=A0A540KU34_MALBA|nr:hypothetical protein C1H46_036952 [Malus baccata]
MPFYYMPQVQGQMEVLDREWVDLYCWTPNGSTIFRVCRDRSYWNLMHGILREFWWENVVPAREALLMGKEEDAKQYIPTSAHKQTGLAIVKSLKLAIVIQRFPNVPMSVGTIDICANHRVISAISWKYRRPGSKNGFSPQISVFGTWEKGTFRPKCREAMCI